MSDALAAAIAAGDADAFADWMRGAERPLRASLQRFAASVDTEAVLQETLLRVWQVAPRFQPDGKPNGLLRLAFRIAHNLAISELRRSGRNATVGDGELERRLAALVAATETRPTDPLLRRVIEKCRDLLPNKPKAALAARLSSHGSEPDAMLAERLGMRKNTFLKNFGRARALLAECLEKNGVSLEQEAT